MDMVLDRTVTCMILSSDPRQDMSLPSIMASGLGDTSTILRSGRREITSTRNTDTALVLMDICTTLSRNNSVSYCLSLVIM